VADDTGRNQFLNSNVYKTPCLPRQGAPRKELDEGGFAAELELATLLKNFVLKFFANNIML